VRLSTRITSVPLVGKKNVQSAALHMRVLRGMTARHPPPEFSRQQNLMIRQSTPVACEIIEGSRKKGMVLVADHARRDLPAGYNGLGLPAREFERHIAYDIGVEAVTRHLARLTAAPAIMAGFSRLLIDPNRGEDDPTLIRQLYDGTIVPGNYPLSEEERERRLAQFYRPYHAAVSELVASVAHASGAAPFVVSIHSFTPFMQGRARPWHVGVLWDSDPRAVKPLLAALRADGSLVVGDNVR